MEAWNYKTIKMLAKAHRRKVSDLIALANQNDPFYVGTESDLKGGGWFADLWNRFGYKSGVHLRRVHYQVVSQKEPVSMPNGKPYENTEACWDYLSQSSKAARYLDLVDPAAFVDRRNPEPMLYSVDPEETRLFVKYNLWRDSFQLPSFPDLPDYDLTGYMSAGRQRYHLEVWCEKSTMNDVIGPLCRSYGANLVTGVGEMSITACLQLTRQRMDPDKPLRIFYVSDFDPAGQSMPVAVSRKVEYFVRNTEELDGTADVQLYPVVLSGDQVRQYQLPRTPIKETERRAGKFEERYGQGAVELDALEALYPGELRSILQNAMMHYRDQDLDERVSIARWRTESALAELRQGIIDKQANEYDQLRTEYEQLSREFGARVSELQNRAYRLWEEVAEELESQAPDLEENHPIPDAAEAEDPGDALYDSMREYVDQIAAYKTFQGKKA